MTLIWKYFIYIILIIFPLGAAFNMNTSGTEFEKRWDELSKDVNKLNEYTAKHSDLELKNIKIELILTGRFLTIPYLRQ